MDQKSTLQSTAMAENDWLKKNMMLKSQIPKS